LLAYVGTLQPRKRIDVAIEATERLVREGLPVTLAIAGRRRPGFDPPWLASPPRSVRLLGEVSGDDLVELLGAADAMVSPSSYEGFGLTFAEAMACGTPVVGVAVTSVPEVVGDGGLLVEAPDAGLVAEALARLLRDPELRAAKSRAASERAARLSWKRAAHASAEVYRAAQAH
jgi:alpha-1,3-rhamnosyl/mannosyltransferase